MKKLRLIASLTSIVSLGSIITTSCSSDQKSNLKVSSTSSVKIATDEKSKDIKISATFDNNKVKIVKVDFAFDKDNVASATFTSGDENESTVTINRIATSTCSVKLTITAYDENDNKGNVDITIDVTEPEIIDISTLNWVKRNEYGLGDPEKLKARIKSDNANVFTAWDKVDFNVFVENTNINVSITSKTNAIYTGSVSWNATYLQNFITYKGNPIQLQDEINPNKLCTSWIKYNDKYYIQLSLPLANNTTLTLIQGENDTGQHTDFEDLTAIDLKACDESIKTINDSFLDMDPDYESYTNATPFSKLESINLSGLKNITRIKRWFLYGCSSLKTLDLSVLKGLEGQHTTPVVGYTFACYCNALEKINFGNLDSSAFTADTTSGSIYYKNSISFAKVYSSTPEDYKTTVIGKNADNLIIKFSKLEGQTVLDTTYYRNLTREQSYEEYTMKIKVNDTTMEATMEANSSAHDLKIMLELSSTGTITINAHDYNNMEKVGPLGQTISTNDKTITTQPGDLILYQGNQFVIYYEQNTYSLTKLGHINNMTQQQLKDVLGTGDVTIELTLK